MRQLPAVDRELIPDVRPTIDALLEQVLVLGDSLRRLEENVGTASMDEITSRIAAAEGDANRSGEWERKRELLERQRTSIQELQQRQTDIRTRFERASLLLENLRLDVLKLRSSGVQSASEDVAGATQQARALSRDIRNAIEAADEVKSIR
jgi:serine/threonine-protein kinase